MVLALPLVRIVIVMFLEILLAEVAATMLPVGSVVLVIISITAFALLVIISPAIFAPLMVISPAPVALLVMVTLLVAVTILIVALATLFRCGRGH
jgi:hypothetical protein